MSQDPSEAHALAQHVAGLRALARLLVANAHDAEDLLHDAYLLAERHVPPRTGSERTWLGRILRNLAHSRFRSAERRARREARAALPQGGVPPTVDLAARREMLELVTRSVLDLDAPLRDAVLLCFFEGRSQGEAAHALGITIDVLRYRMKGALRELRSRLDKALGHRAAWDLSLCGLLGLPPSLVSGGGALVGGAIAMKKLVLAAAALLLLGLGGWWVSGDLRVPESEVTSTSDVAEDRLATSAARETGNVVRSDTPSARFAAQEIESAPVAAAPACVVTGKVISQRRLPVEGAEIVFFTREVRIGTTKSDAAGAFRFESEVTGGWLHANHVEHGAALGHFSAPLPGAAPTALELQLAPACSTTVVVMEGDRAVPNVCVRLYRMPEEGGYGGTFAGEWQSDESGRALVAPLPAGCYGARAFVGSRSGFVRVDLPVAASAEWLLSLQPSAVFEVAVVEKGSEKPIPGAEVSIESWDRVPIGPAAEGWDHVADAEGRCRIEVVEAEPHALWVQVRAEGFQPRLGRQQKSFVRRSREVRFELEPLATLSWPIVADELPVPPDGTVVHYCQTPIGVWPPKPFSTGRIERGRLLVPGLDGGDAGHSSLRQGLALLADGSIGECSWHPLDSDPRPVRFRRPRTLTVRMRTEAGEPVAGVGIVARWAAGWTPAIPTDASGVARITGIHGGQAEVLAQRGERGTEWRIGEADFEAGDVEIEHVLLPSFELDLLLSIAEQKRLPPNVEIRAIRARIERLSEDAANGSVRSRIHPLAADREIELHVTAPGVQAAVVRLEPPFGTQGIERRLELEPALVLLARVLPPSDGVYRIVLHSYDPSWGGWIEDDRQKQGPRIDHVLRFEDLMPRRYRVRDELSGATSSEIDLSDAAKARAPELVLDLSHAGDIEGRVVSASPAALEWFQLERRSATLDPLEVIGQENALWKFVTSDGAFRWRVPGDHPITLRAWHPTLIPDPERGEVEVAGPCTGIELHMIEGPRIRFELPPGLLADHVRTYVFLAPHYRVGLPVRMLPQAEGSIAVLGGLSPGRYDFFFDISHRTPIWLRDVEVRFPETDLGRLALSTGATVRVRRTDVASKPPRWMLDVRSTAGPSYSRGTSGYAETHELSVSGLIAGPHEVRISEEDASYRVISVELDGKSELIVPVPIGKH